MPFEVMNNYLSQTEVSGFGQAELAFSARWKLGAGLRLGWVHNSGTAFSGDATVPGGLRVSTGGSSHSLPATPQYTLSYQPDADQFYYATVAKGFRDGGGNGNGGTQCGGSVTPALYGPDYVWSYELGAKNHFFDRRLQLEASVYDVHWHDVQEHLYDACGNGFTANEGAVASSGFDLTAEARLTRRLRLSLALGYINLHFTRTVTLPGGGLIAQQGTSAGVPAVPAPWSGSVVAEYRWPVASSGLAAYLSAEDIVHSHNPGPFTEQNPNWIIYDPRIRSDPASDLLNLHAGLTWPHLNLEFFVRNALNQQPVLQLYADAPGSALLYGYTLRPRTLGLSGTWRH
jgi:outer membrane receptor protein involved in Fe transport